MTAILVSSIAVAVGGRADPIGLSVILASVIRFPRSVSALKYENRSNASSCRPELGDFLLYGTGTFFLFKRPHSCCRSSKSVTRKSDGQLSALCSQQASSSTELALAIAEPLLRD
ncbi:hypothetical protein ACNJYD_08610 [Bradyrhizobium sp. DASA03005]|uniref:hypothetical protein n=1 Tax=Bradyrhizobium sp. SPXBL-02 TaxID=3395912 RepID=UPI003F71B500